MKQIGRLTKIDLRTAWKGEATDFTSWLAQDENIKLLGDLLEMELEVEAQEERVGIFRADILCKETVMDRYVLIENQLERTDHKHLGQLLTYAAGLDAFTIVWIAKEFTEEHRATLDWLNRITSDDIHFIGIEVKLYQIGDSLPAPMFVIVSKPNDYTKSVRKSADRATVSKTGIMQEEYWTGFKQYLKDNGSPLRTQKPQPFMWYHISIGRSGAHIETVINSRENINRVELILNGPQAKDWFAALKRSYQAEAEGFIGQLIWEENPDSKLSKIYMKNSGNLSDKNSWPAQFKWLKETAEKIHTFFGPKIRDL
jgi:hypothetical protein